MKYENNSEFTISYVACALSGMIMTLAIVGIISLWASIPIVQFSWESQNCVQVVYGDGSCDSLPSKYVVEWVK